MSAGQAVLALGALALLLLLPGSASAGFVTGSGAERTAHLFDPVNGVNVSVAIGETFSGIAGGSYRFVLHGSAGTAERPYRVEVVVSPGSETEARFNDTGDGPAGALNTTIEVAIRPGALPFTLANTPFAVELRSGAGALLDAVEFAVDLRYKEPPADGGLLNLALASAALWALVFLYALRLHFTQRKLRARTDALERSIQGSAKEGSADDHNP